MKIKKNQNTKMLFSQKPEITKSKRATVFYLISLKTWSHLFMHPIDGKVEMHMESLNKYSRQVSLNHAVQLLCYSVTTRCQHI